MANHNDLPVEELLQSSESSEPPTITLLEAIDDATVFKFALHPRLKTPMRTMEPVPLRG